MIRRLAFLACLAIAAVPSTAFAQAAVQTVTWNDKQVPVRENLLSINPLGVLFEYYSAEFEHSVSRATSLAVGASYFSPYDIGYTSVDGIFRYYPAEAGLRGFSIGPSVGFTRVKDDASACFGSCANTSNHAVTVGMQLDYSWILGPSQNFGIELGVGAKRLFYNGSEGRASSALPTARLSVGYAF